MSAGQHVVLVPAPLLGAATWQETAAALIAPGRTAAVAELRVPSAPPHWQVHVGAIVSAMALETPNVLVAHSGAGPLLPAAVAAARGPVTAAVFVDAALPSPGKSRFDAFPPGVAAAWRRSAVSGFLPRWDERVLAPLVHDPDMRRRLAATHLPLPIDVYEEPLPSIALPADLPCAYLQFSDAYAAEAGEARARGWRFAHLPGTHLEMVNRPREVARLLVALAGSR